MTPRTTVDVRVLGGRGDHHLRAPGLEVRARRRRACGSGRSPRSRRRRRASSTAAPRIGSRRTPGSRRRRRRSRRAAPRPCPGSGRRRCRAAAGSASVSASTRSLIATHSMSAPLERRAERGAPDAPEAVDGYPYRHDALLPSRCRPHARPARRAAIRSPGRTRESGLLRGCRPAAPERRRCSPMFQVRIHGRGGQGVVTAAELLSVAAFVEGRHAQAFPTLRLGADRRARRRLLPHRRAADPHRASRSPSPDALIVQDPTLLHQVDLFDGLGPDGYLLVNTSGDARRARARRARRRGSGRSASLTVPATELAREHLGRPLPNAALLGAFAALTGRRLARLGRGGDPRSASPARPARRTSPRRGRRTRPCCEALREPAHA